MDAEWQRPRLGGGAYNPVLRRIDHVLDEKLPRALKERLRLRPFVVARINPIRFSKSTEFECHNGAVLLRRACGIGRLTALLLCILVIASPDAQVGGVLDGVVTDTAGVPLPGTTITVTMDAVTRRALTNEHGRFRFPVLPPGAYVVQAELAGFDTAVQRDLRVERGAVTTATFALSIACITEAVRVDLGFTRTLQQATVVAHLQIVQSRARENCPEVGYCVCVDVVAAVHDVMKPLSQAFTAIEFVDGISGSWSTDRQAAETRYASGQEFVAFLQAYSGRGIPVYVPLSPYMFPVREGRVELRRTDAPGLRDGMAVEDFRIGIAGLLGRGRDGR